MPEFSSAPVGSRLESGSFACLSSESLGLALGLRGLEVALPGRRQAARVPGKMFQRGELHVH
jgi:hypothetical protein